MSLVVKKLFSKNSNKNKKCSQTNFQMKVSQLCVSRSKNNEHWTYYIFSGPKYAIKSHIIFRKCGFPNTNLIWKPKKYYNSRTVQEKMTKLEIVLCLAVEKYPLKIQPISKSSTIYIFWKFSVWRTNIHIHPDYVPTRKDITCENSVRFWSEYLQIKWLLYCLRSHEKHIS